MIETCLQHTASLSNSIKLCSALQLKLCSDKLLGASGCSQVQGTRATCPSSAHSCAPLHSKQAICTPVRAQPKPTDSLRQLTRPTHSIRAHSTRWRTAHPSYPTAKPAVLRTGVLLIWCAVLAAAAPQVARIIQLTAAVTAAPGACPPNAASRWLTDSDYPSPTGCVSNRRCLACHG